MREILKKVKDTCAVFFHKEWSIQEKILLIVDCVLVGVILGILFAPRKGTYAVGSFNGNKNEFVDDWDDEEWIDEED